MVKRKGSYQVDLKENLRDGEGVLSIENLLTPAEMYDKGRLFAKFTLAPGVSIGPHVHEGEMESYTIISGKGEYREGEETCTVLPGDTTLTQSGESHSIKSTGDVPLEFIALILYK